MPTVPRYTRQVQETPERPEYSNVRAPRPGADAFGGAVSEGLQQLGHGVQHVAKVVEAELAKSDLSAAQGLEVQVKTAFNEGLAGFEKLQGESAVKGSKDALPQLEKARESIISKAEVSERARNIAKQRTEGDLLQARHLIDKHTAREDAVVQKQNFEARWATGLRTIATAPTDPLVRDRETQNMVGHLTARARALGMGEEATNALEGQWRQEAASVVLDSLVGSRNTQGAREYFEANRQALGTKAPHFEALLSKMKEGEAAEVKSMDLVGSARDPATGWVDEAKAFAALDAMPPGQLKDETRQRLEHRLSVEDRLRKEQVTERFESALTAVLQGGIGSVDPRERQWLEERAPEKWRKLQLAARQEGRSRRSTTAAEKRAQDEADQRALFAFNQLPDEEQSAFDVHDLAGSASTKMMNAVLGRKKAAGERVRKGTQIQEDDFKRTVFLQGQAAGLDPKDTQAGLPAYVNGMNQWWLSFPQDKKPTAAEVTKEQASRLLKLRKEGFFSNDEAFGFQSPGEGFKPLEGEEQPSALNKGYKAPAPGTAAAPAQKVELVGPNGRTGRMPDGPALETWLKTNPGWRRK